jgi:hypothetical protein
MKKGTLILIVLVWLGLAVPALAQGVEPVELPDTAVNALNLAALVVAALGGYLGSLMTDVLKKLPWLSKENRDKAGRWLAQGVAGGASILAAAMLDHLLRYAMDLDSTGLWQVIIYFGAPIFAEILHRWRKAGQARNWVVLEQIE